MAANRWEEYKEKKAAEQSSGQQAEGQKSETKKKNRYEEYKEKKGESQKHWDDSNVGVDVANSIYEGVNSWLQSHNAYLSNYNSRYKDRKYSYEDAYAKDAFSVLNTVSKQKSAFDAEADRILAYMEQNAGYLDEAFMQGVRDTLSSAREDQSKIYDSYLKDHEYWSSFAPNEEQRAAGLDTAEKVYNQWQAGMKQYNEDLAYDVDAGTKELEELKTSRDAYYAGKKANQKQAESDESFWDSLGRWLGTTPDTTIPLAGVSSTVATEGDSTGRMYDKQIAELEERINRSKYTQGYEGYMSNMDAADYGVNSQYASTRTDVAMEDALWGVPGYQQYDKSKLFGDYTYDYINRNQEALDAVGYNDTQSGAYFVGVDEGFLKDMTDEEIGVYNYLYKTQSPEAANEFLAFIASDLEGRRRTRENKQWAAYAKESPVGSSVFSTLISPLKGISYLGQAADMLDDGAMDENAGYNRFSEIPSTIRSQVSSTIEQSGKWGKVGSFAYNTGMSMADFLWTTGVSGGNQAISLAIMGTGAAADATIAAKKRGLDDGQAFAIGTVAGLAEVAMEKISLGAWLEGDMTEGALRYMLKNALSEAGEEAGTSAVNLLADIMIAGDKSEWMMAMQAYMDAGKSQAEAFGLVAAENAAQIGLDALGGFLSGTAIGGSSYGINSAVAGVQYRDTAKTPEKAQKLVTESLELNPQSQYAQKMKGKVEKGKNLTGMQVRNLLAANREVITQNDIKKIQTAAQARLKELGQTGDVEQLAEFATRWATGGDLTSAEKRTLAKSTYGSRVANELLPENIKSGDFSTEWAEEIGTEIVNAKSYNKKMIEAVKAAIQQLPDAESTEYKPLTERAGEEGRFAVAESGEAVIRESGEKVDLENFEVTKLEDGQLTIKPEGGEEVYAGDIDFESDAQSLAFSGVADMEGMTAPAATEMIKAIDLTKPVGAQLNGLDEAFTYGRSGYSVEDLKAGDFVGDLTDEQMMKAYNLGKELRKSNAEKDAPAVKMRTAAEAKLTKKQKAEKQKNRFQGEAEVYFMDHKTKTVKKFDEAGTGHDEKRMAGVNAAKFLYKLGIGKKYFFYESYEKEDGKRYYVDENGVEKLAPNGIYRDGTGTFYIDLNAGENGQGVTLFTLAHELGHFVKDQSERQFQRLADIVKEAYDKTDLSLHERTVRRQNELSAANNGKHVDYDDAYEEVVCDALSTMMADGSFYEKLAEIKTKDKKLFNSIKKFFQKIIDSFKEIYEKLTPDQQDARDIREMKDVFDKLQTAFAEAIVEASDNLDAAMESVVEAKAEPLSTDEIITDGAVVTDGQGEKHSIRSMKQDIAEGKMFEDLKTYCNWTQAQVDTLRKQLKDLVEYMIPYRDILDMNESYGREGRRFSPYKPNSDPLYKISMDFSTLCSKRLLTQYVIENLQLRENRPMSAEEQMAIRDMLNEYRKVEKGLQVACAMCYVEAARLKSPNQIQRWLDDPTPHLTNYFALKNTEFNASVKKAQADFKESRGYDRNAPKKDMKPADVRELNKIGPKLRSQYQLSAEEQAIVEKAKTLPGSTYLTAGNLANLSETDPTIYDAYTAFVRTATRSKSLETDEPYYYGDSRRDNGNGIIVSDSFIEAVNRENGMRFSSWSDWRIQHMLDYITAVIDNSVRGAAMHGYTKFGDEVRVLGKTGMMFNMSGVTGSQTGLNKDGSLNFSDTESIDVNEAIQLREEFPDTAGLQCIGVGNEHIIALLRSDIIDYVIPYHVSGLNAALRRMADIHGWKDYTGTQHAAIDKSIKLEDAADKEHWHEEPVFSEFFVGYDTGVTGIEAMRASAEKYKQLCRDRGLTPKFNQFAQEENYWKLLIDRKMINQKTGKLIQQKAVTPNFDFGVIKGVVDKFVDNYDGGLEQRALNHIVENWDSIPGRIKELKKGKAKKAADTLANQTVAAQQKVEKAKPVKEKFSYRSEAPNDFNPKGQTLEEQLNEILDTAEPKDGRYLYIGRFTPAFVDMVKKHVNIKDLPIAMNYRDAYISMESKENGRYKGEGINYHNLGINGMKSAIESFGNPEQVLLSKKEGKIELVLEGVDYKGDRILSIVALNTSAQNAQKFIEAHIVTSIYGRRSIDKYVEKAESEGRLIYSKKEELVQGIPQVQYEGDINTDSSSGVNVSQPAEKVNKNSERTGGGSSNRDLLANAFEGITQNSEEYKLIQEYKGRIKLINEYEEKLYKINEQIREITFGTSGKRDTKKLQQLQAEAKELAGHINRNDRKLLNLEASEPLRRVIDRERMKASQKTREHVNEILQNKKVRAEQTELRHKIRKVIRDLDKLLNRGNKKLNVKEDMQGFASKALELADYLFTDHISDDDLIRKGITVRMTPKEAALVHETEEILSKLYDHADSLSDEEFTRLDAKRKANEAKLRDLLTAQRNEYLSTPVYQLFNDLAIEYASFKDSKQEAVKGAYDPKVEEFLRSYVGDAESDRAKALQNMRIADMTTEELWKLLNAYQMVLHSVRTANKLFVSGKAESIEQMVTQIVTDFGSRKIPEKELAIAVQKLSNKIGWSYEKLYYALDRIGSEAFTELIMNLANSENIVMQDVLEAVEFRDKIVEEYGFNDWAVNKKIDRTFLDNNGKKFQLTLGEMMSLYAYSRRKGAWDHIEYGGFVFGKAALTNPKPADSYKLNQEQCEAITNLLTPAQKGYVEAMQKYLSETMGGKGNEVSMMLYGIKMFGEENYFPIHVAGQFHAQANESKAKAAQNFQSMSNAGFTHQQNPNAKAPFVLEGFNDVWSDHVNEMSRYHGTVPALEDIRRVMNRSAYSETTAESTSVKQIMENHYGEEAVKYFDNLYREANSGAIQDKLQDSSKKLLSLFRKNSVAYSLSVLIQQPASVVRAYAMIDRKYFGVKGVGVIASGVAKAVSSKWNKAYANAYNEMLKYAPGVTMTKEIGGFDTATGGSIRSHLMDTGKSLKQKLKTGTALEKGKAVLGVVDDNAIANLPNVADKIAWIEIWNACKREAVTKHRDLAPSSEAFLRAVGERFTEVIRATQVYDSIFAKSPMLKSKNLAVQMLVSFMNEPNTIANMAEKAVRDMMTKGNRMQGLRTAHVLIHSIIFTGVLKSLIYAMRDDDEDETYMEKYMEALVGGLMDDFNPLNYIPIARDISSLAQGYDVERADMAIFADTIDAFEKVIKYGRTDTEDMTEEQLIELDKKQTEAGWKLVESLAAFAGIPVKNVRREINAVLDHARIAAANAGKTTAMSAWDTISETVIGSIPFMSGGKSKGDKLYASILSGDKAYADRIKATYKTEDAYHNAVRTALRENDPRIMEAALAQIKGNPSERVRISKLIIADGFKQDDVVAAINTQIGKLEGGEDDSGAKKVKGFYNVDDFVEEAASGDMADLAEIREDILQTAQANGKTEAEAQKSFMSDVKSKAKEAYLSKALSDSTAKKLLTEYAGMDAEEAAEKISYWAFCKAHPEYDLSESNVEKYHEFAEPEGIPLDVFAQYINGTKGLATIVDKWGDVEKSVRDQTLEVIDSLPLTWQQKDALYLAAGYAESKIWDVPW